VLYRRDDYASAQALLERCEALIALPDAPPLLGTRARLSHALGQVFRQQHQYDKARDAFRTAMVQARLRFAANTRDAEQRQIDDPPFGASPDRFEDHRLLCHWTVGKCLALGLGWIDYTTGQLSSASGLLSAGYALLRATGDVVHRAYATLLIGAVERARAGHDEAGLEAAITILRDGSSVLRAHPRFELRASFELALAYYRLPKYQQQAQEEIRILKTHFNSSPTARSARWHSAVLVIESRMMRRAQNYDGAVSRAQLAIRLAEKARGSAERPADVLAEASIAMAEAQLAQAESGVGDIEASHLRRLAISRLQRALSHGGDNAKIRAVCELHLAHAHRMAGAYLDAQLARARAAEWLRSVEHGFVKDLAQRVDHLMDDHVAFFLDGRTAPLTKSANFERFEVFLIRQAMARKGSQWFELLGLKQRGGTEALNRLRKLGYVFPKFKSGPKS
jgi:tetratricopeptide (TPR) repeat protein